MELTTRELDNRRLQFCEAMDAAYPNWNTVLIVSKVNQYYFMGTMQDGILVIQKGGGYFYGVRLSYQRALDESPLSGIYPIHTYRDMAGHIGQNLGNTYIEAENMPCAILERLKRCFSMDTIGAMDSVIRSVRAIKSPYELHWIERSGEKHNELLTQIIPGLLREGMSEAELVGLIFSEMMRIGYQSISRFHMFQAEIVTGQYGFGENSLYPTCFDGPGGSRGNSAAVPCAGDPNRMLRKGDLVFVDIGFGMNGYHSDKTQVYMFGAEPANEAVDTHRMCMTIQSRAAERLIPGAVPSEIYRDIMAEIPRADQVGFMGYGDRTVKFLGHGVGLHIDEMPIIAEGFHEPLRENMVISLEPKKGIRGIGMVGVEETYIVTPSGGRCITGGARDIIAVNE